MTAASTVAGVDLAGQLNVSANQLVFGSGGGGNLNGTRAIIYPATVDLPTVRTQSATRGEFSQYKVTFKAAGVDCEPGVAVFMNPNSSTCYWIDTQSESGNAFIGRDLSTTPLGAVFPIVLNDVVRLEAVLGGATNTVRAFVNGVLVQTVVDNSALRPQVGGIFGMVFAGVFNGQVAVQDYSGGLL